MPVSSQIFHWKSFGTVDLVERCISMRLGTELDDQSRTTASGILIAAAAGAAAWAALIVMVCR